MTNVTTPIGSRRWNLASYDERWGDVAQTKKGLATICAVARQAMATPAPAALLAAERRMVMELDSLLTVLELSRMTEPSGAGREYASQVEGAEHEARRHREELRMLLLDKASSIQADDEDSKRFLSEAERLSQHRPHLEARGWVQALEAQFNALEDVHRSLIADRPWGQLEVAGDSCEVTSGNFRALESSPDAKVRAAVAEARRKFIERYREPLVRLKKARIHCVRDQSRLLAHSSVEAWCINQARASAQCLASLHEQRSRVRQLAGRYYEWKRIELGLPSLSPCDVHAPLGQARGPLSLEHALKLLEGRVRDYNPEYRQILAEVAREPVVFSNPTEARIDAWFAVPHAGGGTPLLHVIDHGSQESFAASAHELGHCCHTAYLARHVGPFSAADAATCYSELPSLLFEITLLEQAYEHAPGSAERRQRAAAIIEQILHFLLELPTVTEFERGIYGSSELDLDHAFRSALNALWPDVVRWPKDDAHYLLQTANENMPFSGDLYAVTFALAYSVYQTGGRGYARFERDGVYGWIPQVARTCLGVDIEAPSAYSACLSRAEFLIESLEQNRC